MPTEYESEREQIATIYDLRLEFAAMVEKTGKENFTVEEILSFFDEEAKKKKRHR